MIYNPNTGKEQLNHEMTLFYKKAVDKNQNVWIGYLKLTLNDRMKKYGKDSAGELIKLWTDAGYIGD